jgi:hypothetical protein
MSAHIPTFEQYLTGTNISPQQQSLILNSTAEDRNISNGKLTTLLTQLTTKINELKMECAPSKGKDRPFKEACGLVIEMHEHNYKLFQTLKETLLKTPKGGRRQTRRYSKHNKNRKQNLRSRRHRNKQA